MNVFLSTSGYFSRGTLSKISSAIEMVNPTGATDSRGYRHKLWTLGQKNPTLIFFFTYQPEKNRRGSFVSTKFCRVIFTLFSTRDLWVGQMITVIYRRGTMEEIIQKDRLIN